MISIKNYFQEAKSIDFSKLPGSFKSFHETMDLLAEDYDNDKEIRDAINTYLKALNAQLEKQAKPAVKKQTQVQKTKRATATPAKKNNAPKPKPAKKSKAASIPVKKTRSSKPKGKDPKLVRHIDPIVAIAKRFLSCEGKVRSVAYMLRLLASVEKQNISETISKRDANYGMVKAIENEVQTIIRATIEDRRDVLQITEFGDEMRARYLTVARSEKVRVCSGIRYTELAKLFCLFARHKSCK